MGDIKIKVPGDVLQDDVKAEAYERVRDAMGNVNHISAEWCVAYDSDQGEVVRTKGLELAEAMHCLGDAAAALRKLDTKGKN